MPIVRDGPVVLVGRASQRGSGHRRDDDTRVGARVSVTATAVDADDDTLFPGVVGLMGLKFANVSIGDIYLHLQGVVRSEHIWTGRFMAILSNAAGV